MVPQTLVIKAHRQQFLRTFYLRGLFCSAKDFYFVLVLLSAIFFFVKCKQCSVKEVPNHVEFESCRSYRGNFDNSPDVFDGHDDSELVSRYPIPQHSLENICPPSNSFCFPSTLTGFAVNEIDAESDASDASGVQSESFSSGLKQMWSNQSWSPHHGIFRVLGGRIILCSLYQQDVFPEFIPSDGDTKNGQTTDISSCICPLFDKKTHSSKSAENTETVKFSFPDGVSRPPVEIKPSLLDWGHKNMYNPSLAFLTVKNVDADSVLSVYEPYSSNSQFYPCDFSEMLLAPGEVASICFIFFPTHLGLSSAQLLLQTSFGGFLIQAKGFAAESPYLIKPLSGLDISSNGRWTKNLSLFNPFDEALYVEEVTAWISTSSGNTSRSSKSICRSHSMEDSSDFSMLSAKDWLTVQRVEVGRPQIALRPNDNWEVGPQKTETIMELDISGHFAGKVIAAFCMQLLRSPNNEIDTVMVPLEAELSPSTSPDTEHVSLSMEALVPCNTSGSIIVALSVRNDAPYLLSVIKVIQVVASTETFQIKSVEGLILFPGTITQVASVNFAHLESHEVNINCKILVLVNDTRNSQMEIPCIDVISVCSGFRSDSSVGYTRGISNADYINGRHRFYSISMQPPSGIKAVDTREADELILRNWKSQATDSFLSVLDKKELLFPMVLVGNYCAQWIAVKNPSQEPVVMQLILNSGEVIDKCRIPEMPSSSSILVGNRSIAPTRYGFSIAKDALTEAFIHPYGSATFGPILFQPSNRCEWRSSALIRNNLSGVEWLSLRGFGGSLSLVLLEGYNPVQSIEFKLNLPTRLNFSSPDTLRAMGGKTPSCSQPLTKEVYAKNMGDLPLEVMRIKVSGAKCGLDGFIIHNCTGFSLQPGESVKIQISYRTDFSAATVQRDLELALATGVLVIPMKASIPICVLNFCKRSMFWMRVKKSMLVLLFAASLLCLLVFLLFTHVTAFESQGSKTGNNSSSGIHALNSLQMRFSWRNSGAMFPQMNGFLRSLAREKVLLLESASRCSDGLAPDLGNVNLSSGHQKQTNSLLDKEPETRLASCVLSRPSSVENLDMQDTLDSQNLRVRVGKEKGRRRRKKKSCGAGVLVFEVSSSQSGNSTPSSPLSPVASTTPRRPWPGSPGPGTEQFVEARNPFAQATFQHGHKSKCSEPSPKVNLLGNEVPSQRGNNNWGSPAQEKPSLTSKVVDKAVLLPSATFPSAGRVIPPWACHSPILASTSTIAPHARAPGTKLENRKTGGVEEKMGFEQKYTYDIWGNHLFGLPFSSQSKEVYSKPSSAIENNSQSFFVSGPQALVKNSMLQPVISDPEANE